MPRHPSRLRLMCLTRCLWRSSLAARYFYSILSNMLFRVYFFSFEAWRADKKRSTLQLIRLHGVSASKIVGFGPKSMLYWGGKGAKIKCSRLQIILSVQKSSLKTFLFSCVYTFFFCQTDATHLSPTVCFFWGLFKNRNMSDVFGIFLGGGYWEGRRGEGVFLGDLHTW